MPRKIHGAESKTRVRFPELAEVLARELNSSRETGQPLIDEEHFPTDLISVRVIWDKWDRIAHEDRSEVILRAYELAEGAGVRDRVALAVGLTVPEAHASGLLPYQIIPAIRKTDPVSLDQCRQVMLAEGASTLLDATQPQLRFASEEEAEASRLRLIQSFPESEPVWLITKDVSRVEDWVYAESD